MSVCLDEKFYYLKLRTRIRVKDLIIEKIGRVHPEECAHAVCGTTELSVALHMQVFPGLLIYSVLEGGVGGG